MEWEQVRETPSGGFRLDAADDRISSSGTGMVDPLEMRWSPPRRRGGADLAEEDQSETLRLA